LVRATRDTRLPDSTFNVKMVQATRLAAGQALAKAGAGLCRQPNVDRTHLLGGAAYISTPGGCYEPAGLLLAEPKRRGKLSPARSAMSDCVGPAATQCCRQMAQRLRLFGHRDGDANSMARLAPVAANQSPVCGPPAAILRMSHNVGNAIPTSSSLRSGLPRHCSIPAGRGCELDGSRCVASQLMD
jgi:hypothetical protein